jgi:hypothetical protein
MALHRARNSLAKVCQASGYGVSEEEDECDRRMS